MKPCPTYTQFRDFALSQGFTPETLASYVQAGDPLKTAERLLVHLAGTHWDDEPLPYPRLIDLYHGTKAPTEPEKPLPHPLRFRRVPRLPTTELETVAFRNHIRTLDHPQLTHLLFWYSPEVVAKIVESKPSVLATATVCPCGCRKPLHGRQRFASDACRMKLRRRSLRRSRR